MTHASRITDRRLIAARQRPSMPSAPRGRGAVGHKVWSVLTLVLLVVASVTPTAAQVDSEGGASGPADTEGRRQLEELAGRQSELDGQLAELHRSDAEVAARLAELEALISEREEDLADAQRDRIDAATAALRLRHRIHDGRN